MKKLEEALLTPLSDEKGTPKSKTSSLIGKLENLVSPFKSEFQARLENETKALKEARCALKFSNQKLLKVLIMD